MSTNTRSRSRIEMEDLVAGVERCEPVIDLGTIESPAIKELHQQSVEYNARVAGLAPTPADP